MSLHVKIIDYLASISIRFRPGKTLRRMKKHVTELGVSLALMNVPWCCGSRDVNVISLTTWNGIRPQGMPVTPEASEDFVGKIWS